MKMPGVLQQRRRIPVASIFLFLIYLTSVDAQCSTVNSSEDPTEQICASLHLYEDSTYSRRLLSITPTRGHWIFAAVSSDVFVDLYNCWISSNETEQTFPIFTNGCLAEATYKVDKRISKFYKFYGKFLQLTPENIKWFRVQCEVTTDCPATSGCGLACNKNPPRKYLLASVDFEAVDETSGTGTTTNDQGNLFIILVVIVAVFILVFIILLVAIGCMMMHRRRRRGHDQPILVNNTPNGNVYQNGHANASTENPDRTPIESDFSSRSVYATVRKESKISKTRDTKM